MKEQLLMLSCLILCFVSISIGYGATISLGSGECYNIINTSDMVCATAWSNTTCQPVNLTFNATLGNITYNITYNMSSDFTGYFIKAETFTDCINRLTNCEGNRSNNNTTGTILYEDCKSDYDGCKSALSTTQTELDKVGSDKWMYAVGGIIAGVIGLYFYRQSQENKNKPSRATDLPRRE